MPDDETRALYVELARPFAEPFKLPGRGGSKPLDYLSGEQVVSHLNETLGFDGWSFDIVEHGIYADADEVWCRGRLTVNRFDNIGHMIQIVREQFGSQKIHRLRGGEIMELGFDLKGAATDALKKTASLIGVGLWLYVKDGIPDQPAPTFKAPPSGPVGQQVKQSDARRGVVHSEAAEPSYQCSDCGDDLQHVRFKDGSEWTPEVLAGYGQAKFGRCMCMRCYRKANEARKVAAQAEQEHTQKVPF